VKPCSPLCRPGAVNAGTVFAVTIAIVAGLAIAWGVKTFIFDKKVQTPPAEAKVSILVAATNILPRTDIVASMVRTAQVTKAEYESRKQEASALGHKLVTGSAVGLTTIKAIHADDPLTDNLFEPLEYPPPVASLLSEGKTSVVVEASAKTTQLQKDDNCDVICTLANDNPVFGPAGSSAAATLAKKLKVVARFGTTRTTSKAPPGDTRTYTLEAEPWQAAVIELAKTMGGTFNLNPVGDPSGSHANDVKATPASDETAAYKTVADRYATNNRVTALDVALLFGVRPTSPARIQMLERYAGNQALPPLQVIQPPAAEAPPTPGVKPANYIPPPAAAPSNAPEADSTLGFHSANDGTCKTCAKKK
jgi:Flp pilus assembly protein CpaB